MSKFDWMKAFSSPFKRPKIEIYIGKTKIGVPYFLPRKWVNFTYEDAIKKIEEDKKLNHQNLKNKSPEKILEEALQYRKTIPKKFGFDIVSLGWKTKFGMYRHEYNPVWSFVFLKWQIAIMFIPNYDMHYWESWLNYEYNTDKKKSKKERIIQCMIDSPNIWETYKDGKKERINYYTKILRKKYLKLIK